MLSISLLKNIHTLQPTRNKHCPNRDFTLLKISSDKDTIDNGVCQVAHRCKDHTALHCLKCSPKHFFVPYELKSDN